uniref:Uncharacterized protein n=1 Tax=Rhizophagus irregularis (strain DAOM 181602 / DAOM 197198 / MUCL 43194) TaxID=747089 RepID=U9UMW0_RHIID
MLGNAGLLSHDPMTSKVSVGDLEEMKIEYARYNNDLTTISKFSAILSVPADRRVWSGNELRSMDFWSALDWRE